MSNIGSTKISCLLYLDKPIQAELSDFLLNLTPSRKGEILRELLEKGWYQYKHENGVGLTEDEIDDILKERARKRERNRTKKPSLANKRNKKTEDKKKQEQEQEQEKNVIENNNDKENKSGSLDKGKESNSENVSGFKSSISLEDLEDDDDDEIIDPLAQMKKNNS